MLKKSYTILLNLMFLNINNIFSSPKKEPIKNNDPSEQKPMNDEKEKEKNKDEKGIIENNKKIYKDSIKDYNVAVFEDTKNKCLNDENLKRIIEESISKQKFIKQEDKLDKEVKNYQIKNNDYNIEFQKQKTIESALHYLDIEKNNNSKIAILNFADWTLKGGLINQGEKTQEESICRCTTLYQNLTADNVKDYYQSHINACGGEDKHNPIRGRANDDLIYSPNVQIIKDDVNDWNVKDLEKNTNRSISVITCAAPWNVNCCVTFSNKEIFDIHYKKAKRILDVAINDDVDIIILGAYGCGAFYNNPNDVAGAYKKVLEEEGYKKYFKKVVFAIPILGDSVNYDAFYNVFKNK